MSNKRKIKKVELIGPATLTVKVGNEEFVISGNESQELVITATGRPTTYTRHQSRTTVCVGGSDV